MLSSLLAKMFGSFKPTQAEQPAAPVAPTVTEAPVVQAPAAPAPAAPKKRSAPRMKAAPTTTKKQPVSAVKKQPASSTRSTQTRRKPAAK